MTPPFFFAGSTVSTIYTSDGANPSDSSSTSSIIAFFAFIIFGIVAILGVFNLKSHVIIPGGLNAIVCKPVSTSLVT